jgi:hypothetical protein
MAPDFLKLAQSATGIKDQTINDSSLHASVVATLEIERDCLNGDRLSASLRRESLMKNPVSGSLPKQYWDARETKKPASLLSQPPPPGI